MKNKFFLMPIMAILVVFFMIGCPEPTEKSIAVTSVTITEAELSPHTINVGGDSVTLHAEVLPGNASNKTVTWKSSAPAVASITPGGVLSPVAAGTANITASAGSKTSAVFVVNVLVPVDSVTINEISQSPKELVVGGDTMTLTATVLPAEASNSTVTWASTAPTVVSVNATTGVVTALAAGTAKITATAGGKNSAQFTVNTKVIPVESVTINEMSQSPKDLRVGEPGITLTATVLPENASFKTVTWTSSAPAKATVNSTTGAVTAVAEGTADITAKAGNTTSTAVFAVNILPPYISGITITNQSPMLDVGETIEMKFRIQPAGVPTQTVKWSSSNTSVATIDENTGVITAVAKGTTTIKVTSDAVDAANQKKEASVDVRVVSWSTLFFWDADTDTELAQIGELSDPPEDFAPFGESKVGAFRLFNYGDKDWIMQNYLWTGNTTASGYYGGLNPPSPATIVAKNGTYTTEDGTVVCTYNKAGYLLIESKNPCLQIGSTARGRTTSGALPWSSEGDGILDGQFDLSNVIFKVTVEYTPLEGSGQFMYGTIFNGGGLNNASNTPWSGRISSGSGGSDYVDFSTLTMGKMERWDSGPLDTTALSDTQNDFLKTAFITVRAGTAGTVLAVHSIKVAILAE